MRRAGCYLYRGGLLDHTTPFLEAGSVFSSPRNEAEPGGGLEAPDADLTTTSRETWAHSDAPVTDDPG